MEETTKRNSKKWISSKWMPRHWDRLKFNWQTSRICLLKLLRLWIATEIKRLRESGIAMNGKSLLSSFIINFSSFPSPFAAGVNKLSNIIASSAQLWPARNCYKREKSQPAHKIPREPGSETLSSHPCLPRLQSLDGKTYLMKSCFPNAFVIRLSGRKTPATLSQQ